MSQVPSDYIVFVAAATPPLSSKHQGGDKGRAASNTEYLTMEGLADFESRSPRGLHEFDSSLTAPVSVFEGQWKLRSIKGRRGSNSSPFNGPRRLDKSGSRQPQLGQLASLRPSNQKASERNGTNEVPSAAQAP
jgi:hypothetical protein